MSRKSKICPAKPRKCPTTGLGMVTCMDRAEMRHRLLERSGGVCECGCGTFMAASGMEVHHWHGKGMGGARNCDCVGATVETGCVQALTPACHREAQSHRLGTPYRHAEWH